MFFFHIDLNALVAIKLSNKIWYRAEVIDRLNEHKIVVSILCSLVSPHNDHSIAQIAVYFVQVITIDYGTTHIIPLSDIYELSAMFQDYPPQAILFTITNVTTDDPDVDIDILQNIMIEADIQYALQHF